MELPDWPPKDWRAFLALLASIAGAAVLTILAWWLMDALNDQALRLVGQLIADKETHPALGGVLVTIISTLAWGLKLLLAGVIAVLLTLGFAINRRSIKLSKAGLDLSGGEEDGSIPVRVTNPPADPVPTAEAAPTATAEDEQLPDYAR